MRTLFQLSTICLMLMAIALQTPVSANPKPINKGDMAPDIALPDQYGNTLSLSALKGNIVLIYFWASWEPNTDVIAPNLAILHEKYNQAQLNGAKGFNIYTVSMDSDPQEWHSALRRYNFPGKYHVNDFYSTYTTAYGFNKLPTHFLLDESGRVVGVDMTMAEIDRAIAERASLNTNIQTQPITMSHSGNWQATNNTNNGWQPVGDKAYTNNAQPVTYSTSTAWSNIDNTALQNQKQRGTDVLPNRTPIQAMPTKPAQWATVENTALHTQKQRGALPTADQWNNAETLPHASTGDIQTNKPAMLNVLEAEIANNKTAETIDINAITTTAATTKGSHYKIQLGAYKYLNSSDFDKAKPFGTLMAEQAADDVQRLLIGDYTDKILAVETLAKVREAGYTDAFVMIYDSEKRVRPLTKEETKAIAQSKGIALFTAEETTEKISKPLEMNATAANEKETAAKSDKALVVVKDTKVAKSDKALVVVKDTKAAKSDKALVVVKDTKAAKNDKALVVVKDTKTEIPTVKNTAIAESAEMYSVMPMPSSTVYTNESVQQINVSEQQHATSNKIIAPTTFSYETIANHNNGYNTTTPQTYSYSATTTMPQTYTVTDPNLKHISYGNLSEAYTTPMGNGNYYHSTTNSVPSTYSNANTATHHTGNTYQNGVWMPSEIPVFSDTRATSPANGNINFDWYPELNNRTTAPNNNKTATPPSNNKPATTTTNPTTNKTSSSTPAFEPATDRARAAQNLANSQDTPARATGANSNAAKPNSTTTNTTTNKDTKNTAATTEKTNNTTPPAPVAPEQQKELDNYLNNYLKDYEYPASKSNRLKAKEKRNKDKKKK